MDSNQDFGSILNNFSGSSPSGPKQDSGEGVGSLLTSYERSRNQPVKTVGNEDVGQSVDEFVKSVAPAAQRVAQRLNVPVEAVIGQWGVETGWGKSVIPGTNNLGNVKDMSGKGVAATDNATGSRDKYRQYESVDHFADDFANLVGNGRYKNVAGSRDAQAYFQNLQAGGYAEDKSYVQKGAAAAQMASEALKRAGVAPAQQTESGPELSKAPKWADVEAKAEFKALSPEKQAQAKAAYFDYWIAPRAGERGTELRQNFLAKTEPGFVDKALGVAKDIGGSIVDAVTPAKSVMEGQAIPAAPDLPTTSRVPVKPEVRAAFQAQWDAATPEQRTAMAEREDWVGMLAKERAGVFERQDASNLKSMQAVDPRIEARISALVAKGEDPRFAERAAREAAAAGVAPGREIEFMAKKGGLAQKSEFDFDTKQLFDQNGDTNGLNNPLSRGLAKGALGVGKAVTGYGEFLADAMGLDHAGKTMREGSAWTRGKEQAIGESGSFMERNFEGAISSIAQQLPLLITGTKLESEAVPLAGMAMQSFGQEYSDGRAAGQSVGEATTRASIFAAFEVIGEKFGLKENMQAIKAAARGLPSDQIVGFLWSALKKEVPGELLTTTGQFATDKLPGGVGLNPNATGADYLKQVADTVAQTIMQSGVMAGGTTGVSKAVQFARDKAPLAGIAEADAELAKQQALNKWNTNGLNSKLGRQEPSLAPDAMPEVASVTPDGRIEPTLNPEGATTVTPAEPAGAPAIHPTSQTADDIVRELATDAGIPHETVLPTPAPQQTTGPEPVSDQDVQEFAASRYQQLREKRDGTIQSVVGESGVVDQDMPGTGLTSAEQNELDTLQRAGNDAKALRQLYGFDQTIPSDQSQLQNQAQVPAPATGPVEQPVGTPVVAASTEPGLVAAQENSNVETQEQAQGTGPALNQDSIGAVGQPSGTTPVQEPTTQAAGTQGDVGNAVGNTGQQDSAVQANGALIEQQAAPQGQFASADEAKKYISQQRRASSTTLPRALPLPYPDGTFGIAIEKSDGWADAVAYDKANAPKTEKQAKERRNGTQAPEAQQAAQEGSQAPVAAEPVTNTGPVVRDATVREIAAAKDASPMLDLNKKQTGWKQLPIANGNGTILVSADGKKAVTFESTNPASGTEGMRANALAQAYAIDNPYTVEATQPEGELIVKPMFEQKPKTEKEVKAKKAEAKKSAVREMTDEGRAKDGNPINGGDVFRTSSGRETTPYPKQKQERYASQWLIDNAVAEAEARGDKFNAGPFKNTKPSKAGTLTTADRDSMLMYLFGEQPAVQPSVLKPLLNKSTVAEKQQPDVAKAEPQIDTSEKRVDETPKSEQEQPTRFEYPTPLPGQPAYIEPAQRAVVDFMNGEIDKAALLQRFADLDLTEAKIRSVTNRIDITKDEIDSVATLRAAKQIAAKPKTEKAAKAAKSAKPADTITDFGEKIGGAKKDVWTGFKDKLNEVNDDQIASKKLSEVWPSPDYQALIDGGMNKEAVAIIRTMRDEIPAKPRSSWKVKRWAEQVKSLRQFANSIMDGTITPQRVREEVSKHSDRFKAMFGRADLYMEVGHGKSLEGIRLAHHHYTLYKGRENVSLWVVERDSAATAFSNWPQELAIGDTKAEAIAAFKAKYDTLDAQAAVKKASFDIFSQRGKEGYFIGKQIGRNLATIEGPFATVKEAREYRTNHLADLEAKLEKYKEIPRERRDTNEPRVGEDMRNGQDVTPELFANTFGFRGVEFGNWVEQKRRQKDLNDAFDALMDMAAVLGIPAKAISLNGELGLAFGARGSGGKNPAAAHYEPGKVVINLTKINGAGSLGHEWFHALDNYFANQRKAGGYMTTASDVGLSAREANYYYESGKGVRKEMIDAFGAVMKSINQTAMKKRSANLDSKRTKEYWGTGEELGARAFEAYLISKLQDQNASNDYLANIVDEKTWNAAAALGIENQNSYPYPTETELPSIRAGFDQFFQTIQHEETDKGVRLFDFAAKRESQTDTPEFKRWFSDSKMVDADGKPMVMYHATHKSFDTFARSFRGAIFVTPSAEFANEYIDNKENESDEDNTNVMPLYVKAENPFDYESPEHVARVIEYLQKTGLFRGVQPGYFQGGRWDAIEDRNVQKAIKALGFDSFYVSENDVKNLGVYDFTQIKSATGNNGQFDPNNPNITKDFTRSPSLAFLGQPESVRVNARQKLEKLGKKLDAGKITESEFVLAAREITAKLNDQKEEREYREATTGRRRGYDWVVAQLHRYVADEGIDREVASFASWMLDQNPNLANDLGIGITSKGNVAGDYNEGTRVFRLVAGKANPGTAVHEILHHSERMMPKEVQDGVLSEWQRAWFNAFKNGDKKLQQALLDMAQASLGSKAAYDRVQAAFNDGTLVYDQHYQLYSPSEFWAVNATRIMSGRYAAKGSWVKRAVQWFKEFVQHIKSVFGLPSDAPIINALNAVMKGEGKFQPDAQMLVDRAGESTGKGERTFNDISRKAQNNAIQFFGNRDGETLKTFGLYHKTLSTQYNKALKDKHFGKVFGYVNAMQNEVSLTAIRPAELAPGVLPRVDDVKAAAKQLIKGKKTDHSLDQASNAIFDGTLAGDTVMQGKVWSEAELLARGLNDTGIALYKQARAAIDASLDEVAAAEAYAMAQGFVPKAMRRQIIDNPQQAQGLIANNLKKQMSMLEVAIEKAKSLGAEEQQAELESALKSYRSTLDNIDKIFVTAKNLKQAGYAPLMRFGKFTVSVQQINPDTGQVLRDENGESMTLFFKQYETEGEAKAVRSQMQAQYDGRDDVRVSAGTKAQTSHELYSGISPETLALFAEAIGADNAMRKYIELAMTERSALKRRLHRKGTEGYSEDLPRVLSNFITSNGRHAAQRYYLRDLNNAIKYIPKEKGDVLDEAIRLKKFVLNPNDPAAPVSSVMFAWFLGGSVASAIVNLSQPVMMTAPYLSQFGVATATKSLATALPYAIGKKQITDTALRDALKRASQEGIVDAQEIFHLYSVGAQGVASGLVNQLAKIPGVGGKIKAGSEDARARINAFLTLWGSMFAVAEGFNRKLTFIASWEVAKANGEKNPYAFAVRAVNETQGIYNKVNRPNWAQGPVGRTLLTFKQYSIMYVELLSRMWKHGGPEGKRAALIMLAVLMLSAGEEGLPFAQDLDDLIDTVGQMFGLDTNMKRNKRRLAHELLGKALGDMFLYGVSSYLPLDFAGRIGLGNLIPGTGLLKPSDADQRGRQVAEVFGPTAGMATQIGDAYDAVVEGNTGKAVQNLAPKAVKDALASGEMAKKGYATDAKGRKVVDVRLGDAAIKAVGFQPTVVAQETRKTMPIQQDIALQKKTETSIVNQWVRGLADNDMEMAKEAQQRLTDWNRRNPDTPIQITPDQIRNLARQMVTEKDTRLLKQAPREMRGRVGLDLAK